jgi:ABC-type transport system involved in multi-copper enzyme maturation permease subunit
MGQRGLKRIMAVAANAFRESVRERVLYNLAFFALIMTLSGLLLGELSIRQDTKIIKDLGLIAMEIFGSLIALFVGVGLVSKEIERRSLYPLLAKPVTREEFLVGKFLGLGFTLLVNTVVMAFGLYATLYLTSREFDFQLWKAIYPIFLGLLLVVSLALLFSTVTSSALASVCTFALLALGRYADVIRNMQEVMPGVPGWLTGVLYYALPNFRHFDFKNRVVYSDPVSLQDLEWVTAYAFAYIAAVLLLAVLAFRKRELS